MRRRFALLAFLGLGLSALPLLPAGVEAATPSTGMVSLGQPQVKWDGPTWAPNVAANALINGMPAPVCPPESADPAHLVCDHFHLTVDVAPQYWRAHYGGVKLTASWPDPNNKLEISAYDSSGNFVGWSLNGGSSTITIPQAHGTYDVVVDPTIVVSPTTYQGFARIVDLPSFDPNPSLGGPNAYQATPVPTLNPDHPPVNPTVPYSGPEVNLIAHPVGHPSFEPAIGVDKKGAVFIDVDDSMPFVPPVQSTKGQPRLMMSVDHGKTWAAAENAVEDQFQFSTNDPQLYVDPDYGRAFWANLEFNVACCSFISYTDDRGASWTNTIATALGPNDHETVGSGVVPAGTGLVTLDPAFPKIVYYCVNQVVDVGCTRSLDGGRTFLRVGSPNLQNSTGCAVSQIARISADPDGRIFIGSSGCNIPYVDTSSDAGLTWTNVAVSTKVLAAYAEVMTAEDSAGNVYALWADPDRSLPILSTSKDHGMTWSTPVMVAPPDVHEASLLSIDAGSPGRIAIGFVTTTVDNQGDKGRPWSYRIAISQNALDPSPTFLSNVAQLPDRGTALMNRGDCCPGSSGAGGLADFLVLKHSPAAGSGGPVWGSTGDLCTSKDCVGKRDGQNNLDRAMTYAVEEVTGPALVGSAPYLPGTPVAQSVASATAPTTLPNTRAPRSAPLFGLALLAAMALLLCGTVWRAGRVRF